MTHTLCILASVHSRSKRKTIGGFESATWERTKPVLVGCGMEATPTGLFTVFDETAVVGELCSSGEWKDDVAKHAVGTGNTTLAKMIV